MKQRLGKKKHRLCEKAANRKFSSCWVRGGWEHYVALCFVVQEKGAKETEKLLVKEKFLVNWKTGEVAVNPTILVESGAA